MAPLRFLKQLLHHVCEPLGCLILRQCGRAGVVSSRTRGIVIGQVRQPPSPKC